VVRDVTERRRLELQLQLADRLASAATLAAGVAHQINGPLARVLANLDYALGELAAPAGGAAELRQALDQARDGAARVRDIVRDLRTFSHGSDPDRSPVDLRRVLQSTVALAQQEIRQVARLSLELGEVPPVLGGEHRLGQALLNLLLNAVQAIPPGAPQAHLVRAATSVAEDGRVAVEVADTGVGIPADRLARIFDPFFTTRPAGSGLGLGLAIVHAIADDLGGEVRVRSEPGRGSTFTVLLPPAPPEVPPSAGPA
jgi:signal transduction histidine kinase